MLFDRERSTLPVGPESASLLSLLVGVIVGVVVALVVAIVGVVVVIVAVVVVIVSVVRPFGEFTCLRTKSW